MNVLGILTGTAICLAGIGSYLPQFYNIIKYKSVKGINEITLVLMNIGLMCLTMNSIIYSWEYFSCSDVNCFTNLFPFVQITLSWVMVLIYYIIFIIYKFSNISSVEYNSLKIGHTNFEFPQTEILKTESDVVYTIDLPEFSDTTYYENANAHTNAKQSPTIDNTNNFSNRLLYGLHYITTYVIFAIFVIALALSEKFEGNLAFFKVFADILGYTSAGANSIVYLPQIYTLYKNKSIGNLSFLMYIMQTPGNIVIIIFQAIIYSSPVSTWITYVIVCIEQSLILFLMIYYTYCRGDTERSIS